MTQKPALLDTFTRRLRLEGVLTTRTGLHIGAGRSGDPLATDSPVVRDGAGHPYIPGASLKGVIRSAAEALLRSPGPAKGEHELWTCEAQAGAPCVDHERVEAIRERHLEPVRKREWESLRERGAAEARANRQVAEEVWEASCTVCRLFGSLALASRVRFPDLPLRGTSPLLEIRNGVGIDRDRELAADKILYDFEAVPPGTAFDLLVLLENPDDAEVGFLLWLFRQLHDGHLALGGKTSRGLGQVEIDWRHVHETRRTDPDNPFLGLLSSADLLHPETQETQVEAPPDDAPAEAAGPALPSSGDAAAWRALAELLPRVSPIDKGTLGQRAAELGLKKEELNERLGLGLEGRQARKVWDHVLRAFVDVGLLVEEGDGWILAGERAAAEDDDATAGDGADDPHLQKLYDHYVGAMARRWQEAQ